MLKKRILTTIGPRMSNPKFLVLGIATRIPPMISRTLTKVRNPVVNMAPMKAAAAESAGGAARLLPTDSVVAQLESIETKPIGPDIRIMGLIKESRSPL